MLIDGITTDPATRLMARRMLPFAAIGVWSALLASYGYRAGALLLFWPLLMRHSGLTAPFSPDKAEKRL